MPVRTYARAVGVLTLVSLVAGGFGEAFVPSQFVVAGDASATAHRILAAEGLYRAGIAAYLVEALCDVSLTALLYLLLRPAGPGLALLASALRIVATAVFAGAELFSLAPLVILRNSSTGAAAAFTPAQVDALVMLSLRISSAGASMSMVLYGVPWILLGYLTWRSGYLPRWLGGLFAFGGIGFVLATLLYVLAPGYSSPGLAIPAAAVAVVTVLWFLIRGIDMSRWEAKALARASPANAG